MAATASQVPAPAGEQPEPSDRLLARAHARARNHGVSGPVYVLVRLLLAPILWLLFPIHVDGAEHMPDEGAVIIAPNHKSFLDPFFIGLATRRRLRFMAKIEMFRKPFAGLLLRLGAFPVRRGEADADAFETARVLLNQGAPVVVFPEGTRVEEPDVLGRPHQGAARLAFETGAPIVPTAVAGTAKLWLGPLPRPHRIRIAFLPPIDAAAAGVPDPHELIEAHVWAEVQREYGRLLAAPGIVLAALAAAGIGRGIVERRRQTALVPRVIGTVEPRRIRKMRARRRRRRLPKLLRR